MTTPPQIAAETLVKTLTELAAKARLIAEDLDGDNAEHVHHLAKEADDCARMAAIMNMQRESLEAKGSTQIRERTRAGLVAARKRGQKLGRPKSLTPGQVEMARTLMANPSLSVIQVAQQLGVHRATLYRYLKSQAPTPKPVS
jgi:DNA invertase Pin-like site-specific DNA recombinase